MNIFVEKIDSQVFNRHVLQIQEPTSGTQNDFDQFEAEYVDRYNPLYVYVKIPAESLSVVHYFEAQGFRFVEFQLHMTKRLGTKKYDTSFSDGILSLSEVSAEEDIEDILDMADEIFNVDRIYVDPEMGPDMAKKRYRAYLTKSWRSPDEILLKAFDLRNNNLVAFHSHVRTGPKSMKHLLGGNALKYQGSGSSIAVEKMIFNGWIDQGIRNVSTSISLANYKVMEAEYKAMDFKPQQSLVVLRRIYK